jgi:hypothetical protein
MNWHHFNGQPFTVTLNKQGQSKLSSIFTSSYPIAEFTALLPVKNGMTPVSPLNQTGHCQRRSD